MYVCVCEGTSVHMHVEAKGQQPNNQCLFWSLSTLLKFLAKAAAC